MLTENTSNTANAVQQAVKQAEHHTSPQTQAQNQPEATWRPLSQGPEPVRSPSLALSGPGVYHSIRQVLHHPLSS